MCFLSANASQGRQALPASLQCDPSDPCFLLTQKCPCTFQRCEGSNIFSESMDGNYLKMHMRYNQLLLLPSYILEILLDSPPATF